ncbi:MAG: S-methyl-5'-thioadenosine phosphorylase [Nanoarchaeota archaeon]
MKLGIIGGSGLDNPELLQDYKEINVETPYGQSSSKITCGKIFDVEVCIIARHGKKHEITPTKVNNKANIYALKKLECTHIISTTAVGSLKEEIKPGHLVILDQIIDFTKHRDFTFHNDFRDGVVHTSFAEPFSEELRKKLIESALELGFYFHKKGTVITIEGPRFSTRAESNLFRSFGADVINMSIAPEAILAREAGLEYSAVAMSTDYDCWKENEKDVTWEIIEKIMKENSEKVKKLIIKTIEKFSEDSVVKEDIIKIKKSIRTIPDFPKQGIMFRDITTLMKNPEAFKKTIEILFNKYKDKNIDIVAGIESRGFIFGGILAEKLNAEFVPVRKPGKLPSQVVSEEYELEYGKDKIEIHRDAISQGKKVLVVDDLIATGGTCLAACNLIKKVGGEIVECCFVIELPELKGREKLEQAGYDIFSLVEFEGG